MNLEKLLHTVLYQATQVTVAAIFLAVVLAAEVFLLINY